MVNIKMLEDVITNILYALESVESISHKVDKLTELSTNDEYPTAKAVYDAIQEIIVQVGSQSDYDENDALSKTYIRNRQFWRELSTDTVVLLYANGDRIWQKYNNTTIYSSKSLGIVPGKKYTVKMTYKNGSTITSDNLSAVDVSNLYNVKPGTVSRLSGEAFGIIEDGGILSTPLQVSDSVCLTAPFASGDIESISITGEFYNIKRLVSKFIQAEISYNPNSDSPISGKGVAEAIKNVSITIDSSLSTTSKNAVQNKVITSKLNEMDSEIDSKADKSEIPSLDNYYTKSEVNTKLENKQDKLSVAQIGAINDIINLSLTNITIDKWEMA